MRTRIGCAGLVLVVACASSEPKPAVPATISPPAKAESKAAAGKPYDAPPGVPGECINAPGDQPLPASCGHVGSEPPTRR